MIQVAEPTLAAIRRHGEATYPEECCGVLLGQLEGGVRQVTEALPLANGRSDERHRRFLIAPEEYLRAERLARDKGVVLIGFYHSHPDHPARPSAYDLEHALPWHSYVIVGVEAGRAGTWTSWVLAEDRSCFEPEAEPAAGSTEEGGSWP